MNPSSPNILDEHRRLTEHFFLKARVDQNGAHVLVGCGYEARRLGDDVWRLDFRLPGGRPVRTTSQFKGNHNQPRLWLSRLAADHELGTDRAPILLSL